MKYKYFSQKLRVAMLKRKVSAIGFVKKFNSENTSDLDVSTLRAYLDGILEPDEAFIKRAEKILKLDFENLPSPEQLAIYRGSEKFSKRDWDSVIDELEKKESDDIPDNELSQAMEK